MDGTGGAHDLYGLALDAGSVKFDFETGYPYVSGIQGPIYIDTRKVWFEPSIRERAISGLAEYVDREHLEFDIIGGVESGAIAPAALLAERLQKKFVYIKKQAKDHGLKRMIECGDVAGATVLLLEDTVSTGGSSIHGINVLRDAGGIVHDCLVVHCYPFEEAVKNFQAADVRLHALVPVEEVAHEAARRTLISEADEKRLVAWLQKPHEHW